jgi:hypothetical protein
MPIYLPPVHGASYSEAYAEAMAVAPQHRAMLNTLEINHPVMGAPLRVVLNDTDISARLEPDAPTDANALVTFTACQFGLQLPEESDKSARPEVTIWIDGVSSALAQELETATLSLDAITLCVRVYASDDLSGPANNPPLRLELHDVRVSETRVTASASYADFGNTRFPGKTFTIAEYPGLTSQ